MGKHLEDREFGLLYVAFSMSAKRPLQVLRLMYPGQFPALKFNLFNVVLAVDISQTSSANFIAFTV